MKPGTLKKLMLKAGILGITALLLLAGCKHSARIGTVKNNVCKTLEKKVVVYAVFVDSEHTHAWSAYDIRSTLDSVQIAIDWINLQARKEGKSLFMELQYAKRNNTIPFKEDFQYKTLSGTLFRFMDISRGIDMVDKWSNNIAKDVARNFPDDTSSLVLTKNKPQDRERLIAKLRNFYETDNIALVYFINNYYENEISVSFHTGSDDRTEYAVVSNKEPAVIAHEILHLFGALDLYISPFDRGFFARHKKKRAMKRYPNEIMAFAYKDIDSLNISAFTRYLLGWDKKLKPGKGKMFLRRRWKLLEY